MKLSTWAKIQGVNYRTAWQWFKVGTLPVNACQTQTGTVIVEEATDNRVVGKVAAYARVSSSDQKADLVNRRESCSPGIVDEIPW